MNALDLFRDVAALAVAGVVLQRSLWRALLCLNPGWMRVEVDSEGPALPTAFPAPLVALAKELVALGFSPLGVHIEMPRLGPSSLSYDFANHHERVFASAYVTDDDGPRVYFISGGANGSLALTGNDRRPSIHRPGYLAGSLEHVPLDRLFQAHLRRAAELGERSAQLTMAERVRLAQDWFQGHGAGEVRSANVVGLLWSGFGLGILGLLLASWVS